MWEGFCGGLIAAMDGLGFTRFSSGCFLLKNVMASKQTLLISGNPQLNVGLDSFEASFFGEGLRLLFELMLLQDCRRFGHPGTNSCVVA